MMPEYKICKNKSDFEVALRVTSDYIKWLGMDLSFQDINKELSEFSEMYSEKNKGCYILVKYQNEIAGGGALRMLEISIGEIKRMFVYEKFRGMGFGRFILDILTQKAVEFGYKKLRLDTLHKLKEANRLYEKAGFYDIPPYRFNPDPDARYMEKIILF